MLTSVTIKCFVSKWNFHVRSDVDHKFTDSSIEFHLWPNLTETNLRHRLSFARQNPKNGTFRLSFVPTNNIPNKDSATKWKNTATTVAWYFLKKKKKKIELNVKHGAHEFCVYGFRRGWKETAQLNAGRAKRNPPSVAKEARSNGGKHGSNQTIPSPVAWNLIKRFSVSWVKQRGQYFPDGQKVGGWWSAVGGQWTVFEVPQGRE